MIITRQADGLRVRIYFFGDEIEEIESFDPISGSTLEEFEYLNIYPANIFNTTQDNMQGAIHEIQDYLVRQVEYYKEIGKHLEAKRWNFFTVFDIFTALTKQSDSWISMSADLV